MNRKIVVTGGSGRFGQILKKTKNKYKLFYPSKKQLDITNFEKIKSYLRKKRPKALIHLAGLSRPMMEHQKNISKSIILNIIGTANLVRACYEMNIKETDPVLPWNNYAWSKMGGECAVQMYKNSLILRVCMTEKPFVHKKAFTNIKLNFIFHEDIAKMLFKVINKKGVLNIGGKTKTIFDFAKKYNPKVLKTRSVGQYPPKPFMSLSKLNKIL